MKKSFVGKDTSVPLEHQKYAYVVHAEVNAILHSPGSLIGARAYVTLFPCHECAKLIASCKVSEIIYLSDKYKDTESNRIARKIFHLAGIKTRQFSLSQSIIKELSRHLCDL